jgi:Contractile injection system spike tip protein
MDYVLLDGDLAIFQTAFGVAKVEVQPGTLRGSGPATLGGKKLCVDGDEGSVSVPGCLYTAPPHSLSGNGILEIAALAGDQKAGKTQTGGKKVLLKGSQFTARFKVLAPAQQPPPPGSASPIPDATPEYSGSGSFVTANSKLRGS